MKNLAIIGIVAVCLGLTACSSGTRVDVAKGVDSTTAISQQTIQQSAIPLNFPTGATALCRDGNYSFAKDSTVCASNGGVAIAVERYHSE